jgi:coproporphyrinogen III oxidase
MKNDFTAFIDNLQNEITSALEKVDGKAILFMTTGNDQVAVADNRVSCKMELFLKKAESMCLK